MSADEIERKTFRLDVFRFIFQGLVDVEFKTYVLLMAIRVFSMPENMKSFLAASAYIGMAIAPLTVSFVSRYVHIKNTTIVAFFVISAGLSIAISGLSPDWSHFLIFICLAKILYKQSVPFVTDIYNRNYPKQRRGKIIGLLFMLLAISSSVFAYINGILLDQSIENYKIILYSSAFAAIVGGAIFFIMPNAHVIKKTSQTFWHSNLSILFNDLLFSKVLFLWSMTSVAFQMTFPLRMEYLANPKYHLNCSNGYIASITVIIPTLTRILSSFYWGKVFDSQNFAQMKIKINLCFLIGVPLFFFASNPYAFLVSSIALGLGYSGNLTAWQLWVTKIAPSPEKLTAYVSIDVAIMGLRDAFSAWFGYYLLGKSFSLHNISILATILILCSTIGFCFLTKNRRLD